MGAGLASLLLLAGAVDGFAQPAPAGTPGQQWMQAVVSLVTDPHLGALTPGDVWARLPGTEFVSDLNSDCRMELRPSRFVPSPLGSESHIMFRPHGTGGCAHAYPFSINLSFIAQDGVSASSLATALQAAWGAPGVTQEHEEVQSLFHLPDGNMAFVTERTGPAKRGAFDLRLLYEVGPEPAAPAPGPKP